MAERPKVLRSSRVFLVTDLDRSLAFWAALGFGDPNQWGEPRPVFAMANREGFDVMLAKDTPRPNGGEHWDFHFVVADLAAEQKALEAAGIRIVRGPSKTFYSMLEIEVLDPDGYRICLAQDLS
jgi:predicted enzyme related to lactoylglutathione lyase